MADIWFWYFGFYIFIVGLCIGSFLNVVALRALTEEDIVKMPSRCPHCKNNLKWYHNIPLISYIFLRGKCAFCKKPISPQYPITELLNGLLYFGIYVKYGLKPQMFFLCLLVSYLIVISITDIKEKIVYNRHTCAIILAGTLYSIAGFSEITFTQSLAGIGFAYLFFEGISYLSLVFLPERLFGEGDTLIAMGIGAFFGWKILSVVIILSCLLQSIAYIIPIMKNAYEKKKYKKFTAFLAIFACLGAVLLLNVFSDYINAWLFYLLFVSILTPMLWGCVVLLLDIRNQEPEELLMPAFGPALALAAFLTIFYQDYFRQILKSYLSIFGY